MVDVPAGYTKVPADFPGLDPDTRAMIEAGDVFLQGERDGATLIAHARPNGGDFTNPEDCRAASTAMTRATGAKLVAAEVVELPFGKVCRSDVQFEDSKLIARNLSWRLENASSVTVMCNPFEEGEASGIACMRFAASVKAK
ncbi:MAG: hypothetical protein KC731_27775 [Myxococcales bacterium]|nr:hypothetical protein [Myxococcales bacterium]